MTRSITRPCAAALGALLGLSGTALPSVTTTTTLADQPIFSYENVPTNMALVLSVEYPTAISVANTGDYSDTQTYLGYFDPLKCYTYNYNSTTPSSSYFSPNSYSTSTSGHQCAANSNLWSGNFMNWATMQTIDPFRSILSGGYRVVDTTSQTILEKAWGSAQGQLNSSPYPYDSAEFPYRGTDQLTGNKIPSTVSIGSITPFSSWKNLNTAIWGNGSSMVISGTNTSGAATGYYTAYSGNYPGYANYSSTGASTLITASGAKNVYDLPSDANSSATTAVNYKGQTPNAAANPVTYRVYIRVQVCVPGMLEGNCVKYGSNYKPEGLLQQYSNATRFAAISYLNGDGKVNQGGVLREPMNYIGPTYPTPLSPTVNTNSLAEWNSSTGIQITNPNSVIASASSVSNSGVINYLNSFGEYTAKTINNGYANYMSGLVNPNTNTYMQNDNVSELYYAAIRYYENLGNVPEWTNGATTTMLDGFPAVTKWTTSTSASTTAPDPISYYCQKNVILGIGDDHTHTDYNVANNAGATDPYITRPLPASVSSDSINQSNTWLSELQTLEGMTVFPYWQWPNGDGAYSTYFMAGLAYGAHVNNIRPDLTNGVTPTPPNVTVSTYWLDVEEYGYPEYQNPYILATKYGGFSVPSGYSLSNTTPLPISEYDPSGATISMGSASNYTSNQPSNYYLAGNASLMETSLTTAFAAQSAASAPAGTAFALASSNLTSASTPTVSFSSVDNSTTWTDVITASTITFDSNGNPILSTPLWVTSTTLQSQLANTGWQTARQVATWNGTAGVPFEVANLSAAQLAALAPSYSTSTTSTQYLNYLRGDQSNEVGSNSAGGTRSLRTRTLLLGDVVDASLAQVATPGQAFTEANNPGYTAFTTQWSTTTPRPTMVYAAANDGMLHGFVGSSGLEQFAYVPSALFQGPTGTPQVNGLAALGNPSFTHHYYVDATPIAYDIDFNNTYQNKTTTSASNSDWHTLLIGGLGKGGTSFYAIDVTNPAAMTTEATVASNVKWEFTDSTMGYSYGAPIVVKTAFYGWVVAVTSGYDSSSNYGYLYLINPKTGALLQKIATTGPSSGLTQASAYVQDYTDYTSDSIYVGDLNGQLWRFDLTSATGNYTSAQIATLKDASGNAQPVTTAPLIEIHPSTRKRYVMVGTGQFLSVQDVSSTKGQSFYVIVDGTAGAFATPPATPLTRSNLTAVTTANLQGSITLSPTILGWYIDLGVDSTSGYAWRVNVNPSAYNGVVSFAALAPTGSACNLNGEGEVYSVNYATGVSVLTSAPVGYVSFVSAVVNLKYVSTTYGAELIAGLANDQVYEVPENLSLVITTRLLNWRELPSAE
jgi:type IV pilus assembly protein PilY1